MRGRLVDWIATIPFLVAFGTILLVFDVAQRIARAFGQRPQEIVAGWLQIVLVWSFRITGMRLTVEHSGTLEPGASYLFIANHQSMFDIPILGSLLTSHFPKYVSKRSLAKGIPSISYNLRRGGHAIIDRSDRDQATRAIAELGEQAVRRGVSVILYPEGTRARRGALGRFRVAGMKALLAAAPELPVVVVTIDSSWELLRHNLFPVSAGVHVHVGIGAPITRNADEDPLAILREARLQMEKNLDGWRS